MDEKRYLDEEERDARDEEQEEPPQPKKASGVEWSRMLHVAASLAAVTAITLLTFEMAAGSIRLGKIAAYALGSSVLIGVLLLLIISFRRALSKIPRGLWTYTFWSLAIPFAFFYYLIFIYLIYGYVAPFIVKLMGAALAKAP